eukprot:1526837-Rhodomonas_salina.3
MRQREQKQKTRMGLHQNRMMRRARMTAASALEEGKRMRGLARGKRASSEPVSEDSGLLLLLLLAVKLRALRRDRRDELPQQTTPNVSSALGRLIVDLRSL